MVAGNIASGTLIPSTLQAVYILFAKCRKHGKPKHGKPKHMCEIIAYFGCRIENRQISDKLTVFWMSQFAVDSITKGYQFTF
jgi:hypothetical protein